MHKLFYIMLIYIIFIIIGFAGEIPNSNTTIKFNNHKLLINNNIIYVMDFDNIFNIKCASLFGNESYLFYVDNAAFYRGKNWSSEVFEKFAKVKWVILDNSIIINSTSEISPLQFNRKLIKIHLSDINNYNNINNPYLGMTDKDNQLFMPQRPFYEFTVPNNPNNKLSYDFEENSGKMFFYVLYDNVITEYATNWESNPKGIDNWSITLKYKYNYKGPFEIYSTSKLSFVVDENNEIFLMHKVGGADNFGEIQNYIDNVSLVIQDKDLDKIFIIANGKLYEASEKPIELQIDIQSYNLADERKNGYKPLIKKVREKYKQ